MFILNVFLYNIEINFSMTGLKKLKNKLFNCFINEFFFKTKKWLPHSSFDNYLFLSSFLHFLCSRLFNASLSDAQRIIFSRISLDKMQTILKMTHLEWTYQNNGFYLSTCLSASQPACTSIWPSSVHVRGSICLSICPSPCLSIRHIVHPYLYSAVLLSFHSFVCQIRCCSWLKCLSMTKKISGWSNICRWSLTSF